MEVQKKLKSTPQRPSGNKMVHDPPMVTGVNIWVISYELHEHNLKHVELLPPAQKRTNK